MARVTPSGVRRNRRAPMSEINVVPYIDVMLVLLVIFMVTAPLLYHGIDVDLPEVSSTPLDGRDAEPVIVSLDAEGRVYLSTSDDPDTALEREEMLAVVASLLREQPQRKVFLRGDRQVAYGDIVALMAELQHAGVRSIGLMSQPADASAG